MLGVFACKLIKIVFKLFGHFMGISLLNVYIFEKIYTSLELPVYAEYIGFCPNSIN